MLLADAIAEFLRQKGAEGCSPRTIVVYRKRLRSMASTLKRRGVRHVADTTPADLDAWFLAQAERGLKKPTRAGNASTTSEFYRVAQQRGLVLSSPARDLPVPDDAEPALPEAPLDEEEVAALFAWMPRASAKDLRNAAHIELLYGCGLRLRESVMLDLDDVDFARRTVHVREGKGGRERLVPLMKGAAGALRDYLALRRTLLKGPDHGALFLDRRGRRVAVHVISNLLVEWSHERGRHYNAHLFRHSIAVHLLRGGADVRHVQAFLGHQSLETTKIYLRMVPGRLREDYDRAMPAIAVDPVGGGPPAVPATG